jgi:hypothetical protein
MKRQLVDWLFGIAGLLLLSSSATFAQSATTGAIAGVVRDATGAVLPGVTVEAASPALIEKVRTAVTDEQGNYKIVELRPGTYTVTFTLTGFSTVKREGLELTTGFTATANVEMKVGALQETVTVSGASPVVDVQRVEQGKVLSREVLDTIPTGKTIQGFAALTLGATVQASLVDVGGNKGEAYGHIAIHGGRQNDGQLNMEGMRYNNMVGSGSGSNRFIYINQAAVEEINIETGGMAAETETPGVALNVIPKDGGNTYKFYLNTSGTTGRFQGDNLDDTLKARGASAPASVKKIYDLGVGFGGKIVQDKLWFYTAHRWWGAQSYVNVYYNLYGLHSMLYAPDPSRQGYSDSPQRDNSGRLTWQASARNKLTLHFSKENNCSCFDGIGVQHNRRPEANIAWHYRPVSLTQGTWSFPATNKLLVEAGASYAQAWVSALEEDGVLPTDISIQDVGLGVTYNAPPGGGTTLSAMLTPAWDNSQHNERFSVSYVTGSHALKVGVQTHKGHQFIDRMYVPTNVSYTFRFGVPLSLTQWATPGTAVQNEQINLGAYVQDQWTLHRLTLNLGVRFDYLNAYVPAQTRPAAQFVPAIPITEIPDVPNWKDISPRMGAAYDLFGNGKTAVKGYLSRYVNAHGTDIANVVNPASGGIGLSATRTWTDVNGNFVPDCDLYNSAANGECGALNSTTFGKPIATTTFSPEVINGWGKRDYTWQGSIGVQQELRPKFGVNVTYFRTTFGNITVLDNLAVTPTDFSPYCITAPTDSRLGSVSGQQLCGLYDVNPNKFGQVNNLVKQANDFGNQWEHYNGFDFGFSLRYGKGGFAQGGLGIGHTVTDNCFLVNSPQGAVAATQPGGAPGTRPGFCHVDQTWGAGTQAKVAVSYPIIFGFQASANVQNLSGFPQAAQLVVTNAQIAPSLGRNLAAGPAATATIDLFAPNTHYEKRYTQVDLRLTKTLKVGRGRIQAMADLYNALNAETVLGSNSTYGPTWLTPTSILGARLFKVGGQVEF